MQKLPYSQITWYIPICLFVVWLSLANAPTWIKFPSIDLMIRFLMNNWGMEYIPNKSWNRLPWWLQGPIQELISSVIYVFEWNIIFFSYLVWWNYCWLMSRKHDVVSKQSMIRRIDDTYMLKNIHMRFSFFHCELPANQYHHYCYSQNEFREQKTVLLHFFYRANVH